MAFALRFWPATDLLDIGFPIIQKLDSNVEVVGWNDMFDPFHNASDDDW